MTPLGVDRAWFAAAPGTRSGAAATRPPTMIFVGLLKPHKNVGRLLRAFARVQRRIPHRLVLVARHEGFATSTARRSRWLRTLGDRVELVDDLPLRGR